MNELKVTTRTNMLGATWCEQQTSDDKQKPNGGKHSPTANIQKQLSLKLFQPNYSVKPLLIKLMWRNLKEVGPLANLVHEL